MRSAGAERPTAGLRRVPGRQADAAPRSWRATWTTRRAPPSSTPSAPSTGASTWTWTRADRSTAVFTVDAVEVYDEAAFPDRRVYGPAGRPELRLITCGGAYHEATGYAGDAVVYAHLTRPRPT